MQGGRLSVPTGHAIMVSLVLALVSLVLALVSMVLAVVSMVLALVSLVLALVSLVLALVSLFLAVIPVAMAVARPMAMPMAMAHPARPVGPVPPGLAQWTRPLGRMHKQVLSVLAVQKKIASRSRPSRRRAILESRHEGGECCLTFISPSAH